MPKRIRCRMCGFEGEVHGNRKSCPDCGAHGHCAPTVLEEGGS